MDYKLSLITGQDIPIPEYQLTLHQPTIEEISLIGEDDFFIGIQTLTLDKKMFIEDKNVLDQVNNFQVFMTVMNDESTKDKRKKVIAVLQLMRLGKAAFTPQSLILTDEKGENHLIDETNFEILQKILKDITCAVDGPMDQQAFNPADAKAKEIADKLMRGRARVAAQKGGRGGSLFGRYLSILSVGLHIPLITLTKYTMFQLNDIIERYMLHINWDLDIRTRLAGGKPETHPDDWMKSIH